MSIAETNGRTFQEDWTPHREVPARIPLRLLKGRLSTDPLEIDEQVAGSDSELNPSGTMTTSVVTTFALGSFLASRSSRPIDVDPVWTIVAAPQEEEEEIADFFEPPTFEWNKHIYIARMAARRYSEQTDADY